jgi:SRSO17 transposase
MDTCQETGTSILDQPEAVALLESTTVTTTVVRDCERHLTQFLEHYLPFFYRKEQRENATIVVEGLLSGLKRKTCEPIAREHGVERKPIQFFVGAGKWDDEKVMAEVRRQVKEQLGEANAVLVLDPSSFPKKGTESCGVQRQWSGRLGKIDNCQVGVFLCYAAAGGRAPLDRRLYLPEEWAADAKRREKCHVPEAVVFQEKWRIGLDMLDRCRKELPHAWVAVDSEFGRCSEFRKGLRERGERYVLDVPCNTLVRDLQGRRPRRKHAGKGRMKEVPFVGVEQWAAQQPASRWQRFEVRAGEKGPLVVDAMTTRVRAKDEEGHVGKEEEKLLVMRTVEAKPRISYSLSNADSQTPLAELTRARGERYWIEQMFEQGKGETGLGNYEVRSWVGWHHHLTLALLALWFLVTERGRVGEKRSGRHGSADSTDMYTSAARSAAQ